MSGLRRTRARAQGRQAQPRNQRRAPARNAPAQRRMQALAPTRRPRRRLGTTASSVGADGSTEHLTKHPDRMFPSAMAPGHSTHLPVPLSEAASVPYVGKVDFDVDTKDDGDNTDLLVCIPANNSVAAMVWEWKGANDQTKIEPTIVRYEHVKKKLGITGFSAVAADVRICNVTKSYDVAGGIYSLNARGSFEGLDAKGCFVSGAAAGPNDASGNATNTTQEYKPGTTAKILNDIVASIKSNPEHKFMAASELRTKHTLACIPKKAVPDITANCDTVLIPQDRIWKFQESALISAQLPARKAGGFAVGTDGYGKEGYNASGGPALGEMHNNESQNNLTALYFYIPFKGAKNIYHITASTHFRMRFSPDDMMSSLATLPPSAPPSYFNRVRDFLEAQGSTMKPVIEYAMRQGLMPYMQRQMALRDRY